MLLGCVLHVSVDMIEQNMVNTLWAVTELELQVDLDTGAALCAAQEREALVTSALECAQRKACCSSCSDRCATQRSARWAWHSAARLAAGGR